MQQESPLQIDLLIHARWVIPANGTQSVLEDHSIAVHEGRITSVLPTENSKQLYVATEEFNLSDHALIPGLVNAHGHAAMSLLRGAADDLTLHTWLHDFIWPLESRWVSEQFVYEGTQLAIAEMLLSGTTCFADMYFFPDAAASDMNAGVDSNRTAGGTFNRLAECQHLIGGDLGLFGVEDHAFPGGDAFEVL